MTAHTRRTFGAQDIWHAIVIALVVVACWCLTYHRLSGREWRTPPSYDGDALSGLAGAKAMAEHQVWPILPKTPAVFNAPFQANWNDYPSVEEGVWTWQGILTRLGGVAIGANLSVLAAHLLAALCFFVVCRILGYHPTVSAGAALLFGLSHFAFIRSFSHLTLAYFWHLPLGYLAIKACFDSTLRERRSVRLICLATPVIFAVQNPYYTGLLMQFLGASFVYQLILRAPRRMVLYPVALGVLSVATFCLMNVDTFVYRLSHGPNPNAVVRNYAGVELYALKLTELFMPFPHRLPGVQQWVETNYLRSALFVGEVGSPYLGIVGIGLIGLLAWGTFRSFRGGGPHRVPAEFWPIAWIVAFAVPGGINGLLATFGIVLFRSSNRYSIAILMLVLLYGVRLFSTVAARSRAWITMPSTIAIVAVGLLDQIPPGATAASVAEVHRLVDFDRKSVALLERNLPPGAMIFQLPVMDFPESPPREHLGDYELLKPYIHSHQLRFSYGTDKGRFDSRWQQECEALPVEEMVRQLEHYGFSAILVDTRGYPDGAKALRAALANVRDEIHLPAPHLLCFRLNKAAATTVPAEFRDGWYGFEGKLAANRRWSAGNAEVVVRAPAGAQAVHVKFSFGTLQPRTVDILRDGTRLYSATLEPGKPVDVDLTLTMNGPEAPLKFVTDVPARPPGNGDTRSLAFELLNFRTAPAQ